MTRLKEDEMERGSYWHTEMRISGASKALRRGQVRDIGGRPYVLLHPSSHRGEWICGAYGDGITAPVETRLGSTLCVCRVVGRVVLAIRQEGGKR